MSEYPTTGCPICGSHIEIHDGVFNTHGITVCVMGKLQFADCLATKKTVVQAMEMAADIGMDGIGRLHGELRQLRADLTEARLEAAQAREELAVAKERIVFLESPHNATAMRHLEVVAKAQEETTLDLADELDQRNEELSAARRECERLMVENGQMREALWDISSRAKPF